MVCSASKSRIHSSTLRLFVAPTEHRFVTMLPASPSMMRTNTIFVIMSSSHRIFYGSRTRQCHIYLRGCDFGPLDKSDRFGSRISVEELSSQVSATVLCLFRQLVYSVGIASLMNTLLVVRTQKPLCLKVSSRTQRWFAFNFPIRPLALNHRHHCYK